MYPLTLSLAEKGVKQIHARTYTVPRAVDQQLRTETSRLRGF
jgi:hypothetical protein